MTSLESRIHADAGRAAGDITSADIPPLRLPAARGRRDRIGRVAGARNWLVPLAAAASVVAITAAVILVGRADTGSRAPLRPLRPAATARASGHAGSMLGTDALDYFFPATGAQYTTGLAYGWTERKIEAHLYGSCMARAGSPQPPFSSPEQAYLESFPDNSQFPDLAQRARTGNMTGLIFTGAPGQPRSAAGRTAARSCQAQTSKPFAAINKIAGPLQNQWLDKVTAIQTSAAVAATQPGFAVCLQAHGIPPSYAEQQRPTASNPLFIGFFAWMDHLDQAATTTRQMNSEQHRWTPVFVRCAGPAVTLMQRLQLAQRARFFTRYAQQVAMISKLATELPDAGR